jgi:hypothetical protein
MNREDMEMAQHLCAFAVIGALLIAIAGAEPAFAQKSGGVLKIYHRDSPASMSILEEATNSTEIPMMGVFNNLVLYKQDVAQNSLQSIIPDLATDWAWNEDGSELSFRLREGAKWHDGHPFTANDIKCTWDLLLGKSQEKLRANPRKAWYQNVETVTADADLTATFHLKRPQPAIIALLASGYAPVYPCHVPPRDMRQHPIGTGPFKFVEFKPNEYIKVARNPDYWKRDRPYLDGIEYTVIPNRSTAILSFIAGKFDMTFPFEVTVPLLRDVKSQAPQAICELVPANQSGGNAQQGRFAGAVAGHEADPVAGRDGQTCAGKQRRHPKGETDVLQQEQWERHVAASRAMPCAKQPRAKVASLAASQAGGSNGPARRNRPISRSRAKCLGRRSRHNDRRSSPLRCYPVDLTRTEHRAASTF